MAQLSSISMNILMTLHITPSIAILFSVPTFINGDIFTGDVGPLIYSGTCIWKSGNYTRPGTYQSNLSTAFSNLTASAAASRAFSNTTVGRVHASFYCIHGVGPNNCHACVWNITRILSQNCSTREAVVYSNRCILQYSDTAVFTEDDTASVLFCNDIGPTLPDPVSLNQTVVGAMKRFLNRVGLKSGYYYSAVEEATEYSGLSVYTAVQCAITDGSGMSECKDCLVRALNETIQCLSMGATWGVDYRPSCQMRYDLQPFKGSTSPTPAPAPEPNLSHPTKTSNSPGSMRSTGLLWIITTALALWIKDIIVPGL